MKLLSLHPGIAAGLLAALLFGASAPLAKLLLARIDAWLLAGLLYLGSGIGLWLWRLLRASPPVRLPWAERWWLVGAVVSGGLVGPVLLMLGLSQLTASRASLLLNAEALLTALLAWGLFRESVDRRVALGMLAIVAGGVVLVWAPTDASAGQGSTLWPSVAVLGACLAWAVDNNLMRKVALADPVWLAMVKGLAAGSVNLLLALWVADAKWPGAGAVVLGALLGLASYGASLAMFIVGLRELGVARAGAYFSVAPFFGAALAVLLLGEPVGWPLLAAGALMAIGVALHLAERHSHGHQHEPTAHDHVHTHGTGDAHHDHGHATGEHLAPGVRHAHPHRHEALVHEHPHYPDAHHRHEHP